MLALSGIPTRDSRNQAALDGTVSRFGKTTFSYNLWANLGSHKRFW